MAISNPPNWSPKLKVTRLIARMAKPNSRGHCLLAEAARQYLGAYSIDVTAEGITFNCIASGADRSRRYRWALPAAAIIMAERFDDDPDAFYEKHKIYDEPAEKIIGIFTLDGRKMNAFDSDIQQRLPQKKSKHGLGKKKRKSAKPKAHPRRCPSRRYHARAVISMPETVNGEE